MAKNKGLIIGISGDRGSFCEEAAQFYRGKHNLNGCELRYLITVDDVLSELTKGTIDKGIFPIENSNGGVVIEAIHGMAKYVFTVDEFFDIDVRHNLLVIPGTKKEDIGLITSHDQALKQCRMYLKRNWPNVHLEEYADTAKAAKDLGKGKLPPSTAVIAPRSCAELYGLEILEEGIQDLKFNFTTFLTVTK